MWKPHLSMGQHNGFINMVWYKIIFRLKKNHINIFQNSSLLKLLEELIYKNKGKSKKENLDIISNCLVSLNHVITQGIKWWKMEWFFSCLYVIWNSNYFFPRINLNYYGEKNNIKDENHCWNSHTILRGMSQITSKPLLREVFNCYMVNPFGTPCSKWRDKRDLLYSLLLQLPRRQQWISDQRDLETSMLVVFLSHGIKLILNDVAHASAKCFAFADGPYGNYELAL